MKRFVLLCIGVLLLTGVALAQSTLPGVPAEYQAGLTLLISLLSAGLTYLLTAIAKRVGRTSGVQTVTVSAVLSLVVVISVNLWQAWSTRGDVPWPTALVMALLSFLGANGAYLAQVAAATKGAQVAGRLPDAAPAPLLSDPTLIPGFQAEPEGETS